MRDKSLSVPIAFIVFNRPDHTLKSFKKIKAQKPKKLFLIADGPRSKNTLDDQKCKEVKKIIDKVDWECQVYKNYAKKNMGCKARVVSGLDWLFSHVDKAIIIEDDCVADNDFFLFCENLLYKYEFSNEVMIISGNNFHKDISLPRSSYYFSKYPHVWGWATWRKAWNLYDPNIDFWKNWKKTKSWQDFIPNLEERLYWERVFDMTSNKEIDTWDYQLTAISFLHNWLIATPSVNLVSNIGFGSEATHTFHKNSHAEVPIQKMDIKKITHPKTTEANKFLDGLESLSYRISIDDSKYKKIYLKLKSILKSLLF